MIHCFTLKISYILLLIYSLFYIENLLHSWMNNSLFYIENLLHLYWFIHWDPPPLLFSMDPKNLFQCPSNFQPFSECILAKYKNLFSFVEYISNSIKSYLLFYIENQAYLIYCHTKISLTTCPSKFLSNI